MKDTIQREKKGRGGGGGGKRKRRRVQVRTTQGSLSYLIWCSCLTYIGSTTCGSDLDMYTVHTMSINIDIGNNI